MKDTKLTLKDIAKGKTGRPKKEQIIYQGNRLPNKRMQDMVEYFRLGKYTDTEILDSILSFDKRIEEGKITNDNLL